jgi:hypothetical protein
MIPNLRGKASLVHDAPAEGSLPADRGAVNERAGYGDYLSAEVQLDETIDDRLYLQEQCLSVARHGWAFNADSDWRSTRELVAVRDSCALHGTRYTL